MNEYPANLYIAPMSDPLTVSGSAVLLARPQYDNPSDTKPDPLLAWKGQLNEAPAFLIRKDTINLVYDANSNTCTCYAWGLLINRDGRVMNPQSWTKRTSAVFSMGSSSVPGPGNHFFTKSPDGTQDWAVYSAPTSTTLTRGEVLTQKFTWNADNTLNFGTPIGNAISQARPSGEPDSPIPYQLFYNAEYQTITDATIIEAGFNATGWQTVGDMTFGNSDVRFDHVDVPAAGTYPMLVRYAAAGANGADQPIKVNGYFIRTHHFDTTSSWDVYNDKLVLVDLNAGRNTVEFSDNGGDAQIDGFEISMQQASFAALSGGARVVVRSGALNGRVVGNMTTSASCVRDWRLWAPDGSYTLLIRYDAPTKSSITVSVNGSSPTTLPPRATGVNAFSTVTTGIVVTPMAWNFVTICRASGSPEIDSYFWYKGAAPSKH